MRRLVSRLGWNQICNLNQNSPYHTSQGKSEWNSIWFVEYEIKNESIYFIKQTYYTLYVISFGRLFGEQSGTGCQIVFLNDFYTWC